MPVLLYTLSEFDHYVTIGFSMAGKKSKKSNNKKTEATIKGRLVELIVASLHEEPGVKVERNVRLPSILNSKRKREIDILLTGTFSGYPIRIAIECKNYKSIIDAPKIDAFVGKLQQIGIPSQHGVFVSAHGFTSGAIDRAKEAGIIPLILTGLTSDRLAAELFSAVQSIIYLFPEIIQIRVRSELKEIPSISLLWFLYDENKKLRGSIPDIVWKMWIEGKIRPTLGEFELDIPIPNNWQNLIDGELKPILLVSVKLKIRGLVGHIQGQATEHTLINPAQNRIDKFRVDVSFETNQTSIPLQHVFSEDELQNYLNGQSASVRINLGRVMLPRIYFYYLYWPLSERSFMAFSDLVNKCYAENRTPEPDEIKKIEGDDLRVIWEKPWEQNPILYEFRK
jgi:hypothetical protein